nr:MAG TPA: hypothetical protein [Caudoviricetes sp.]
MSYIPEPITRIDKYLAYIAGNMDVALPDHPITRKEHYLAAWAEKSGFEDVDVAGEPPLTLENGIGKPLKGLKVYGRSKQITTTGAQLFPPPTPGSQENNGITVDCMEGGKIHISGTAGTMVDFYVSRLQLSAGTYTLSAGVNIDASVLRYALVTKEGVPYFDVNGDYTTDTIAETIDVSLILRVYAGKTIELTVQPMLNAGSAPLPWEPYTGGKPSPSPDYPQEIESVGMKWSTGANLSDAINATGGIPKPYGDKIGIGVRGKNLLDPAQAYQNTTSNYKMYKDGFQLKKGVIYTLSCYPSKAERLYINSITEDGNKEILAASYGKSFVTYTPNKDVMAEFNYYASGKLDPATSKLMLEIGENNNPAYEPYHKPQSMAISTPNGLPGIPVSSGGNYTDADGQQWVCDEIDFARGMYVQRVYKSKLADLYSYFDGSGSYSCAISDMSQLQTSVLCNIAKYEFNYKGNGCYIYNNTIVFGTRFCSKFATYDDFKDMIQEKSGIVYTVLTTPIETPLTSDQIVAYKQLHTYKGTTIIDNDAGAYMSVKYEKMK